MQGMWKRRTAGVGEVRGETGGEEDGGSRKEEQGQEEEIIQDTGKAQEEEAVSVIAVCRNVHANTRYFVWRSVLHKIFHLHVEVH